MKSWTTNCYRFCSNAAAAAAADDDDENDAVLMRLPLCQSVTGHAQADFCHDI